MGHVISMIRDMFFSKRLEIALVGLDNSGKTTFCNQLAMNEGGFTTPTIGLNVRVLTKNRVTFKVWDIGGQEKYRQEWPRYVQGVDVIVFILDTSDPERLNEARHELHALLECPQVGKTPVLVLANKIDIEHGLTQEQVIKGLNLDYISDNSWLVIAVSAKYGTNVEEALSFLTNHGH